jgi:DNA primase
VWVSEGFFDASALEWCAPETDVCLASVRAKLTQQHVDFLRRFCRGMVNMLYDNDETGRNGTDNRYDRRTRHSRK